LRLTRRTDFKTIFCGVPHFFTFVSWSALVVSILAGGSEPNNSAPENNNPMWQKSDCAVELPCGSPTVDNNANGSSRRGFIARLAALSASITVAPTLLRSAPAPERGTSPADHPREETGGGLTEITLNVNGTAQRLRAIQRFHRHPIPAVPRRLRVLHRPSRRLPDPRSKSSCRLRRPTRIRRFTG